MDGSKPSAEDLDMANITSYQAGVMQSQAHRKLRKEVSNFLKPYGLTMMEWFALGLIKDSQKSGLRMTKLSSDLQTTLPYTTNLINGLMHKGFILRGSDKNDSRAKQIKLAPGVRKRTDIIESDLREKLRSIIYINISPEELTTYIKVLYKIAN